MAQPIYLDPELQGIERERQLAQALQQRGMKPLEGQVVGNRFIAPSWTQQLANLYDVYSGGQRMASAEKKAQDYASALRGQTSKDIEQFFAGQGKPEETVYGAGMEGPTKTVTSAVPAVPYGQRISQLAQSKSPTSQALASQLWGDMLKPRELAADASLVQMTPEGKYETVGGGAPKLTNDIKNYQYDVSQGYKGTFNQWSLDQKRANAQNINVSTGLPFQEKIYENSALGLMKDFDTLKSIPSQIKQLDKVEQLAPKSFAGSAANVKLEAAKFLNNNLGLNVATDKIGPTEELRTVLFTNIMDNLKKMDASPSQEQQRIMQASLGNIGTDPAALPRVVNVYKEILIDKAQEHNRRVRETSDKGFKYPYSIEINVPTAKGGGADAPKIGEIRMGYRYLGGNPANEGSWEKVGR